MLLANTVDAAERDHVVRRANTLLSQFYVYEDVGNRAGRVINLERVVGRSQVAAAAGRAQGRTSPTRATTDRYGAPPGRLIQLM